MVVLGGLVSYGNTWRHLGKCRAQCAAVDMTQSSIVFVPRYKGRPDGQLLFTLTIQMSQEKTIVTQLFGAVGIHKYGI